MKNRNQTDTLVQSVRIISKDAGMKLGIEKCATLNETRKSDKIRRH